jgi:DNA-binding transcriptional ArsR family regulator
MDTRKLVVASAFFVASAFVLSFKLLFSTPINVYLQQGQSTVLVNQVKGFYSWTDVAIVAVAAMVLGWSAALMLSSGRTGPVTGEDARGPGTWGGALEQKKALWEEAAQSLKDDEAAVFRAIISAEGVINQGDLVKGTGMPKSTVSRCLDILESRGLVERRRRGMGNVVVLK